MIVAELIEELKKYPPNNIVLIPGKIGYDDVVLPLYEDNVHYKGYSWPNGSYRSGSGIGKITIPAVILHT